MKLSNLRIIFTLSLVCCIVCSGCISDGDDLEPVPDNVDTTPLSASELQAEWEELQESYESKGSKVQESLESLKDMAEGPDLDYEELYQAFDMYKSTVRGYLTTQTHYYKTKILLEYTTPISGDQLKLRRDSLPFSRPDGDTYTFAELNMMGESYMGLTNRIESYIEEGIGGQDTRQVIIEELGNLEEFLPGYYDMGIGYVYYYLNSALTRQARYSNILIQDCNPDCI